MQKETEEGRTDPEGNADVQEETVERRSEEVNADVQKETEDGRSDPEENAAVQEETTKARSDEDVNADVLEET